MDLSEASQGSELRWVVPVAAGSGLGSAERAVFGQPSWAMGPLQRTSGEVEASPEL